MKLAIGLENFKGVFAYMCVISDDLSFALVKTDKSYSLTLPRWKSLCHRYSRDQPQPRYFLPTTRESEKREPGNEDGMYSTKGKRSYCDVIKVNKSVRKPGTLQQ